MVYAIKDGARVSGDAQAIGEALERIRDRYGKLTAKTVLTEARKPKHVLHGQFEWDDSTAAEKYRLAQAGMLIRAVVVTFPEVDESPRAFLPVSVRISEDRVERRYEPLALVLGDSELSAQVLTEVRSGIAALRRKLDMLSQAEGLISALAHADEVAAAMLEE